jgi:hypothetical protein
MRVRFAFGVAALWAGSYIYSVASSNYAGVNITTPVMLMASAFLLSDLGRKNGNGTH